MFKDLRRLESKRRNKEVPSGNSFAAGKRGESLFSHINTLGALLMDSSTLLLSDPIPLNGFRSPSLVCRSAVNVIDSPPALARAPRELVK